MLESSKVFNGFYQRSAWLLRASGKARLLMLPLKKLDLMKNNLIQVGRRGWTATARFASTSVPPSYLVPPNRTGTPARAYIYAPQVRVMHIMCINYKFKLINLNDKVGQWDGCSILECCSRPTSTSHLENRPTFKKSVKIGTDMSDNRTLDQKRQHWESIKTAAPDLGTFLTALSNAFGKPEALHVVLTKSGEIIESGEFDPVKIQFDGQARIRRYGR